MEIKYRYFCLEYWSIQVHYRINSDVMKAQGILRLFYYIKKWNIEMNSNLWKVYGFCVIDCYIKCGLAFISYMDILHELFAIQKLLILPSIIACEKFEQYHKH